MFFIIISYKYKYKLILFQELAVWSFLLKFFKEEIIKHIAYSLFATVQGIFRLSHPFEKYVKYSTANKKPKRYENQIKLMNNKKVVISSIVSWHQFCIF